MKHNDVRPAYFSLFLLVLIVILGIIGFMIIEKYGLLDAFYMTIITIATVGFSEVHPLSPEGRFFTAFLIIFSIGIFAYAVTTFTRFVVDGVFRNYFKYNKVKKLIDKLSDHVIVVGYGRNGSQAAIDLEDHNMTCLVIEKRDENIARMLELQPEILYIKGDATKDDTLKLARVHSAKALVAALPSDADNLFVVLTAREMNPKLRIVSRASNFTSIKKLRRAGATNVIMPDKIGGQRMAKLVAQPDIIEFLDLIMLQKSNEVTIDTVSCQNLSEKLREKTIGDLNLRNQTGANIIGLKSGEGNFIINPPAQTIIKESDKLFVLGKANEVEKLKSILHGKTHLSDN